MERFGGPVGVDGVESLGREAEEIFTLGLRGCGGGTTLLEVTLGEWLLTPFCAGPAMQTL